MIRYNLEILTKVFFGVVVANPHASCHQQKTEHPPFRLSPDLEGRRNTPNRLGEVQEQEGFISCHPGEV